MTTSQKKTLILLGYEDTQEDGAILQHRGMDKLYYIWDDDTFEDVLSRFHGDVVRHTQKVISRQVWSATLS